MFNVTRDLRGSTSRLTSVLRPAQSVARRRTRQKMLSEISQRAGIDSAPLAPVVSGWNGWTCVSWCSSIQQLSRLAASVPSSASVPSTATVRLCPALNRASGAQTATGALMAGCGS